MSFRSKVLTLVFLIQHEYLGALLFFLHVNDTRPARALAHLLAQGLKVLVRIRFFLDLNIDQLSFRNLLSPEPISCFAQCMIVNQVLDINVLLLAVSKRAHACPAAGEFMFSR